MENVNLKRKVTLKRKGDTPGQTPEGKKPNKFIWLAILGVVIIGGIFGIKQLNQSNDTTGGVEEVIVSEDVTLHQLTMVVQNKVMFLLKLNLYQIQLLQLRTM